MPDAWPDGARCALALSFDCDHETFELGAGRAAIGRLAWGEYGRRRGVPRILSRCSPATTCAPPSSCPPWQG
jgi:peptidoglycan-N-acetylglucosamine deacetylase